MGSGEDRFVLLQFLRLEAKELELAINTVEQKHAKCCHDAKCEHGKLLRMEYERLTRQHATKEEQMNALINNLIGSALQQGGYQSVETAGHRQESNPATRPSPSSKTSSCVDPNANHAGAGHTTTAQAHCFNTASIFAPPPQPSTAEAPRHVNSPAFTGVLPWQTSTVQHGGAPFSSTFLGSEPQHDYDSSRIPGHYCGSYGRSNYGPSTQTNTGFNFGPGSGAPHYAGLPAFS